MMRIIIIMLLMAFTAVSCQTRRLAVIEEEPPVVIAPVEEPEPIPEPEIEEEVVEIPVQEERFSFETEEDQLIHEPNMYYVIVGSFRSSENARRFTQIIENQGLRTPVILVSETGLHRVSVNSYTSESAARARIMQIRRDFPQYEDTWLLIRQTN